MPEHICGGSTCSYRNTGHEKNTFSVYLLLFWRRPRNSISVDFHRLVNLILLIAPAEIKVLRRWFIYIWWSSLGLVLLWIRNGMLRIVFICELAEYLWLMLFTTVENSLFMHFPAWIKEIFPVFSIYGKPLVSTSRVFDSTIHQI